MKLEVGMYTRFDGKIGKVKSICTCGQCKNHGYYEPTIEYAHGEIDYISCYWKDNLKASFNLIDLIEVGDYVNGYKVNSIDYNFDDKIKIYSDFRINEKNIKEILTHEQYNSNKYVIGGDNNA